MLASDILELSPKQYRIVPLGSDCFVTHQLRAKQLRSEALPFDWNVTPIQTVMSLFASSFRGFLSLNSLIFLPPTRRLLFEEDGLNVTISNDIITPVVCRKYNMLFPHDFPVEGEAVYDEIIKKYHRRINRLQELCLGDLPILFVAHNGLLNEWQKKQFDLCSDVSWYNNSTDWRKRLTDVLVEKYPALRFAVCDSHTLLKFI
jgi:hypothetical protein